MFIYCPQCEYTPTEDDLWCCDCGHEWNTFGTRAVCPACTKSHEKTSCPHCSEAITHSLWYHSRPAIGFLHSCENCKKPVSREHYPQPARRRQHVLRYLTTEKYERLLRDSGLYLARLDQFKDPYEGSLPLRIAGQKEEIRRFRLQSDEAGRRLWTKQYYVSCWHAAQCESDAMWRLYCGDSSGVCLVSTYERLAKLEAGVGVRLGAVTYIDYHRQSFAFQDSDAPMMHKRLEFAHEREVRLVTSTVCEFLLVGRDQANSQLDTTPLGRRLHCDVNKLVIKVLVNPSAKQEYFDEIVALTSRYEKSLASRVAWSSMRGDPSF